MEPRRLILCIHQPPRATLRSVHDGKQVGELLLPNTVTRITGAWWIESDEQPPTDELGDLMKRGSNTPGSAHSLLARLPLLEPYKDPLPAKPNPLGAPMTFGLPDPKPAQDWRIPSPVVQGIQSLPPSPMAASLAPIDKVPTRNKPGSTTKDEQVDPNRGTLVVIADSNGLVHLFLDGRYAMGEVRVYPSSTAVRMSGLSKRGSITSFGVYGSCLTSGMTPSTSLTPTLVHVSLATAPETLKVARASSTVKALLEYIHLGIEELEIIWCGRSKDGRGGVKDIGSFWAKIILEKERAHAGRVTRGPIAQLTQELIEALLFHGFEPSPTRSSSLSTGILHSVVILKYGSWGLCNSGGSSSFTIQPTDAFLDHFDHAFTTHNRLQMIRVDSPLDLLSKLIYPPHDWPVKRLTIWVNCTNSYHGALLNHRDAAWLSYDLGTTAMILTS
ncbi:unnamed protein product [Rhizoctonia solani]|uniref:Uncharacterized protein n=1 Tax=Rhizoctonia solani TaxID=456999 RepID=A0A8H3CR61_9AGAM|nr:unnamed protein product [Rhizoctonia solani]